MSSVPIDLPAGTVVNRSDGLAEGYRDGNSNIFVQTISLYAR